MRRRKTGYSSPERVLDLLLSLGGPEPAYSVQSIARKLGTSRSSTYRYLLMLRKRGLIEEAPPAGHYRLGSRILRLARFAAGPRDVVAAAEPVMRALALDTRETVLLTRRVADRSVCVACVESPQAVRIAFEPARNTPLHAGSAARIHLAHLDPEEIDRLLARPLERLTPRTPSDPARLRRELAAIRRRGYALSAGEVDSGVRSVSAPVFDAEGRVLAGLTLAGPTFRLTPPLLRTLAPKVIAAARRIAARAQESPAGGAAALPNGAKSATLRLVRP